MRCWIFTSEKTMSGSLSQAEGLAQALHTNPEVFYTFVYRPWRWLPIRLQPKHPWMSSCPKGSWPDILIASGKGTIIPALAIKKANPATRAIYLQKPSAFSRSFDTIVMPTHDGTLPNAINTLGAMHRASPNRIKEALAHLPDRIKLAPSPTAAILIGGNARAFKLDYIATQALINALKEWSETHGITLILLPSRRTPDHTLQCLSKAFSKTKHFLWDPSTPSPYLGTLGIADTFVITEESVSMASEAASTGKPIYLFPLTKARQSKRIQSFQNTLIDQGIARWFNGKNEHWQYSPLNETERIAKLITASLTST